MTLQPGKKKNYFDGGPNNLNIKLQLQILTYYKPHGL